MALGLGGFFRLRVSFAKLIMEPGVGQCPFGSSVISGESQVFGSGLYSLVFKVGEVVP